MRHRVALVLLVASALTGSPVARVLCETFCAHAASRQATVSAACHERAANHTVSMSHGTNHCVHSHGSLFEQRPSATKLEPLSLVRHSEPTPHLHDSLVHLSSHSPPGVERAGVATSTILRI